MLLVLKSIQALLNELWIEHRTRINECRFEKSCLGVDAMRIQTSQVILKSQIGVPCSSIKVKQDENKNCEGLGKLHKDSSMMISDVKLRMPNLF